MMRKASERKKIQGHLAVPHNLQAEYVAQDGKEYETLKPAIYHLMKQLKFHHSPKQITIISQSPLHYMDVNVTPTHTESGEG
jgi:hypothetical protein